MINNNKGLIVIINKFCNMNCKYCYLTDKKKKIDTSKENVGLLVDLLAKRTDIKTLLIFGGEPTDSKYLFYFFEKLYNIRPDMNISIITNGYNKFSRSDIPPFESFSFQVSVDPPAHQNVYRKDYDRVYENILHFDAEGFKFHIHSVVYDSKLFFDKENGIKKFIKDINRLKSKPIISIKFTDKIKRNIFVDIKEMYNYIKLLNEYPMIRSNDIKSTHVCAQGRYSFTFDMTNNKIYACHESCFYKDSENFEVGTYESGDIILYPEKIEYTKDFANLYKYYFQFKPLNITKGLKKYILTKLRIPVCFTQNYVLTNNPYMISNRQLMFTLLFYMFYKK